MYCPNCGEPVHIQAQYCVKCGMRLPVETLPADRGSRTDLATNGPRNEDFETLLEEARNKLWDHKMDEARGLLDKLAQSDAHATLAYAYSSFLKRMQSDVDGALKDAQASLVRNPECFEAHAARFAAFLTGRKQDWLENAMLAWNNMFAEAFATSSETDTEVTINFKLTPITRAAARMLDGYPQLALQELSEEADDLLVLIGRGLAQFRCKQCESAKQNLVRALSLMPARTRARYGPPVRAILRATSDSRSVLT